MVIGSQVGTSVGTFIGHRSAVINFVTSPTQEVVRRNKFKLFSLVLLVHTPNYRKPSLVPAVLLHNNILFRTTAGRTSNTTYYLFTFTTYLLRTSSTAVVHTGSK